MSGLDSLDKSLHLKHREVNSTEPAKVRFAVDTGVLSNEEEGFEYHTYDEVLGAAFRFMMRTSGGSYTVRIIRKEEYVLDILEKWSNEPALTGGEEE